MSKSAAKANPFLILREAFAALLPVVIIMNSVVLFSGLTGWLGSSHFNNALAVQGGEISRLFYFLIPLFLNISLGSLLAKEKDLDQIGTTLIAMVCFLRVSGYLGVNVLAEVVSYPSSILASIPCTWIAIWSLHRLSLLPHFEIVEPTENINPRLRSTLNLLIPGLITILCFELVRYFIQLARGSLLLQPVASFSQIDTINAIQEFIVFKTIALSAWFVGLHGEHTAEGFFRLLNQVPIGNPYRIHLATFHDVFANIGGTGSTFVVPFLILLKRKTTPFRTIANLSIPFAFFNINETLLFGLPLILNLTFLIPFVVTPFANAAIALTAIHFGLFSIETVSVHWMSPPIYSAYAASNGSLIAVLTQLFCILIDGCIYLPFVRIASRQHNAKNKLRSLLGEDAYGLINAEILHRQERQFIAQQKHYLNQQASAHQVLKQLQGGRFILHYQPKVDAISFQLVGAEALLRFETFEGQVLPPTFLPVLYEQGLSKFVDRKVVNLIFSQVQKWQSQNLSVPPISINFDKDFLLDRQAVDDFIIRAKEHDIYFYIEITEHTYAVELKALAAVIEQLRAAGHYISIDDFGAGYSSLTTLLNLNANEIKLDRKLVVPPEKENRRGLILLAASVELCHDLGFSVVAEGIENASQVYRAQRCGVDILQGYHLGRPMSADDISHHFRPVVVAKDSRQLKL